MKANVYLEDVNEVYQSTVNGDYADDLFLTKDEAIKWTKEALKERSEELTDEEMEKYGFNKDAEEYVEVIDFKRLEEEDESARRAVIDKFGNLFIEYFDNDDGEWYECDCIYY